MTDDPNTELLALQSRMDVAKERPVEQKPKLAPRYGRAGTPLVRKDRDR